MCVSCPSHAINPDQVENKSPVWDARWDVLIKLRKEKSVYPIVKAEFYYVDHILTGSFQCDHAHGKYRFLEALLNIFDSEEIIITRKCYDSGYEYKVFLNSPVERKCSLYQFYIM